LGKASAGGYFPGQLLRKVIVEMDLSLGSFWKAPGIAVAAAVEAAAGHVYRGNPFQTPEGRALEDGAFTKDFFDRAGHFSLF